MRYFKSFLILLLLVSVTSVLVYFYQKQKVNPPTKNVSAVNSINENPLTIEAMRKRTYPGSDLIIEETLPPGSNYNQYIASYLSDGLKIYGLLSIPQGTKPPTGWPVIIFNHGYIQPNLYKTTENYVAYVEAFAKSGYLVFKPDYRGNGNSEGQSTSAYYSSDYATDVLNAVSTLKRYPDANPNKIGMWGHSMGGNITLRALTVNTQNIKATVIWGGVVGSYNDLIYNWQSKVKYQPSPLDLSLRNMNRQKLLDTYGTPSQNPTFWQAIDPTYHLADITTPIQLHTGGADEEVPVTFSVNLKDQLEKLGKIVEYYNYPGGDHNISSPNFEPAMQRSIAFFDKYLKSQ